MQIERLRLFGIEVFKEGWMRLCIVNANVLYVDTFFSSIFNKKGCQSQFFPSEHSSWLTQVWALSVSTSIMSTFSGERFLNIAIINNRLGNQQVSLYAWTEVEEEEEEDDLVAVPCQHCRGTQMMKDSNFASSPRHFLRDFLIQWIS